MRSFPLTYRTAKPLAVFLTLAAIVAPRARAQETSQDAQDVPSVVDSSAALAGQVLSVLTADPMVGATVFLRLARRGAVTDSSGKFRIDGLPPGPDTLAVWYAGYDPQFAALQIEPDRLTRAVFLLAEKVFEVAELKVELKRGVSPRAERLERRKKTSGGVYITREMIEEAQPTLTSDMLRGIPRVEVDPYRFGDPQVRIGFGASACLPNYFVDGVYTKYFNLDDLGPHEVEEIEIYRGPAEMPTEYKTQGNRCGVIVVWTRGGF